MENSICRNCGEESHCGVMAMTIPLPTNVIYKREGINVQGRFLGEAVCKYCRCKLCDDGREPWPGPGVQEKQMAGIDCINEECKNPLCDCDPCDCTEETPCICCEMWDGE